MKNALRRFFITCALLVAVSVEAQITTINPVSSYGTITFNDVNSLNPSLLPGSSYSQGLSPWSGVAVPLSQTDPTTLDSASGILDASTYGPITYPILLNNITLTQPSVNTGNAQLNVQFGVQYQIGAGGSVFGSRAIPKLSDQRHGSAGVHQLRFAFRLTLATSPLTPQESAVSLTP